MNDPRQSGLRLRSYQNAGAISGYVPEQTHNLKLLSANEHINRSCFVRLYAKRFSLVEQPKQFGAQLGPKDVGLGKRKAETSRVIQLRSLLDRSLDLHEAHLRGLKVHGNQFAKSKTRILSDGEKDRGSV